MDRRLFSLESHLEVIAAMLTVCSEVARSQRVAHISCAAFEIRMRRRRALPLAVGEGGRSVGVGGVIAPQPSTVPSVILGQSPWVGGHSVLLYLGVVGRSW